VKKIKRRKRRVLPFLVILVLTAILIRTTGLLWRIKEPPSASQIESALGITYQVQSIPPSQKRPEIPMRVKYIVVHNTANPNSTAQNERDYLVNPVNTSATSFHIVVDEHGAIEAIPLNEMAFHSGDSLGNAKGIGIEICESGDYDQAEENAVKLIAFLAKYYKISPENIKTHKDFSGKDCPRKILSYWDDFIGRIKVQQLKIEVSK
jgi:N-acetylmuramoyl-L-alanine amidase